MTPSVAGALEKELQLEQRLDAVRNRGELRSSRSHDGERPGLGIGLAIVDAIATAHDGSCTLEPSTSGSRFALRLPSFEPARREAEAQAEVSL